MIGQGLRGVALGKRADHRTCVSYTAHNSFNSLAAQPGAAYASRSIVTSMPTTRST